MFQVEKIFPILATGSSALIDLESNSLGIKSAQELRIVRHSNIDCAVDVRSTPVCRVERCVLNAIPINLPDVKVFFDFFDLVWYYVVSYAPDILVIAGRMLLMSVLHHLEAMPVCTGSCNVCQKDFSIRVTTLPGAAGVPR